MKKQLLIIILSIIFAISCLALTACGFKIPSKGLEYQLTDDGTYSVIGLGECTKTDIVIPAEYEKVAVTSIAPKAFQDKAITSITIPQSVTSIGNYAFSGCSSLESVNFQGDSQLESLGKEAFAKCAKLQSITIPKGIKELNDTFDECRGLKSVTFEEGSQLEKIVGAFHFCVNLPDINIPSTVTIISSDAFSCCKFESIVIPAGVTYMGGFSACASLKSVTFEENSQLQNIADSCFESCTSLQSITIPASVNRVGKKAFSESGLTSIVFEQGCQVTDLYGGVFSDCSNLTSVVFPQALQRISDGVFENCTSLQEITIPASVVEFGSNQHNYQGEPVFAGCTNLKEVTFEQDGQLEYIGIEVFKDCTGIESVNLPNSVTNIMYGAFNGCTNLKNITIPSNVTEIGNYAFYQCTSLTNIAIPDSTTLIGQCAFMDCKKLAEISIGGSPEIGEHAFDGTSYHQNKWVDGMLYIDNCLIYASASITNCTIKEGTTSIAGKAFQNCTNLTTIVIPSGVKIIGEEAFRDCTNLKSITIPTSVTKITAYAFYRCNNLKTVNYQGTSEQWDTIKIEGYNDCLLDAKFVYNYNG